MKDIPKLIENCEGDRLIHLLEMLPNLSRQPDRDFYTVICRFVQQQQKDLGGHHFIRNLLVAQMRYKGGR